MPPAARRTAGTKTFTDNLRWLLGRRVTPEQDMADLHAGNPLLVVAFRHEGRWRQGSFLLHLGAPDPISWNRWPRGAATAVSPGSWLRIAGPDAPRHPDPRFVTVLVGGPDGVATYAVPQLDLPVVQESFALTSGPSAP